MYRNIEARSCKHCCSGKALIITYCKCDFGVLDIEHVMRMHHIVICGLPRSITFFHLINGTIFENKNVIEHKMCVVISSINFV